jgi:hypothetical protein
MNFEEPKHANERPQEDRWLDEALAQYSAAEPRLGLENRILANLEAHATQRQRRWFFSFAGAVAAALFVVLIMTMRNVIETNPRQMATPKRPPSETVPTVAESARATSRKSGVRAVDRHSLTGRKEVAGTETVLESGVKQEHFPADRPLSEQDRLLLMYLSQTSHQEMEHVVAVQPELAAARQRWEEETNSEQTP